MAGEKRVFLRIFLGFVVILLLSQGTFAGVSSVLIEDGMMFDSGEFIDGGFTVRLEGSVDGDAKIRANFAGVVKTISLVDALEDAGYTVKVSGGELSVSEPSVQKSLVFPQAGLQRIAFQLPSDSQVTSINMRFLGLPYQQSFVTFPSLDVDIDGSAEWEYFGKLTGMGELQYPQGLDVNDLQQVILGNQNSFFCEMVNLSYSKSFQIGAYYSVAQQQGDLWAYLLSVDSLGDQINAYGGSYACDLPEVNGSMNWGSCEIQTLPIQGMHLACIYNKKLGAVGQQIDFYYVGRDNGGSSAYVCGSLNNGKGSCSRYATGDFFISVRAGQYDGVLAQKYVDFGNGTTEFFFPVAINQVLSECGDGPLCVIPIAVKAKSAGILVLQDLEMRYSQSIGPTGIEKTFYDVMVEPKLVLQIDNSILTNESIEVSLSLESLGLVAFSPEGINSDYDLSIDIAGVQDTTKVQVEVSEDEVIGDVHTVKDLLEIHVRRLQKIESEYAEVMEFLKYDVDGVVLELQEWKQQIEDAEDPAGMEQQVLGELNDTLARVPIAVSSISKVEDVIVADAPQIRNVVDSEDITRVLDLQRYATIHANGEAYKVQMFNGGEEFVTKITKHADGSVRDGTWYEMLPKNLVKDLSEVKFSRKPTIVQADPIVSWKFDQVNGFSVEYLISGNVLSGIRDFVSVVDGSVVEESPQANLPVCGDGFCSVLKTKDGTIIALEDSVTCPEDCGGRSGAGRILMIFASILLVGGVIVYMLMHKQQLMDIFGRNKLFENKVDEQRLTGYVKMMIAKKTSKEEIERQLLAKGWKLEQVQKVFGKVKK